MKIALLNLQYDNNYGGNLQRYALMTVLQRLGHDVTHLNMRCGFDVPLWKAIVQTPRRLLSKYLKGRNVTIFSDKCFLREYENRCSISDPFYNRYIKHTEIITSKKDLCRYVNFDAYLVGSDQVWRNSYAKYFGIGVYFFDWLKDEKKRFAYSVSLGTDEVEFSNDDIPLLTKLYSKFSAVSVREKSAMGLLSQLGWSSPSPEWTVDPTLLLSMEDYMNLINDGTTTESKGNMFCYILDPSNEKDQIIKEESANRDLIPFDINVGTSPMGIQQWIKSFYDSKFIVTDSYHGFLFSIIFNKPFRLIMNSDRGNSRFDSVLELLSIKDMLELNWDDINDKLSSHRILSIDWLNSVVR